MNKTTNKKLAKANALRKAAILSQTTTDNVLHLKYARYGLINANKLDYKKHLQWMYIKAIQVAISRSDVHDILSSLKWNLQEGEGIPELEILLDKYLSLCNSKTDVQHVMSDFCGNNMLTLSVDSYLSYENCFIKIFNRAHDFDEK